MIGVVVRGS